MATRGRAVVLLAVAAGGVALTVYLKYRWSRKKRRRSHKDDDSGIEFDDECEISQHGDTTSVPNSEGVHQETCATTGKCDSTGVGCTVREEAELEVAHASVKRANQGNALQNQLTADEGALKVRVGEDEERDLTGAIAPPSDNILTSVLNTTNVPGHFPMCVQSEDSGACTDGIKADKETNMNVSTNNCPKYHDSSKKSEPTTDEEYDVSTKKPIPKNDETKDCITDSSSVPLETDTIKTNLRCSLIDPISLTDTGQDEKKESDMTANNLVAGNKLLSTEEELTRFPSEADRVQTDLQCSLNRPTNFMDVEQDEKKGTDMTVNKLATDKLLPAGEELTSFLSEADQVKTAPQSSIILPTSLMDIGQDNQNGNDTTADTAVTSMKPLPTEEETHDTDKSAMLTESREHPSIRGGGGHADHVHVDRLMGKDEDCVSDPDKSAMLTESREHPSIRGGGGHADHVHVDRLMGKDEDCVSDPDKSAMLTESSEHPSIGGGGGQADHVCVDRLMGRDEDCVSDPDKSAMLTESSEQPSIGGGAGQADHVHVDHLMGKDEDCVSNPSKPSPSSPQRNVSDVGLAKESGFQQPSSKDPRKPTATPLKEPSEEMKDQAVEKGQAGNQSELPIRIMDSEQNQQEQAIDPNPANPERNVGSVGLTKEAGFQQPSSKDPRKLTATPLKEPSQEMKDQAVEKGEACHQSESPIVMMDNVQNQHEQAIDPSLRNPERNILDIGMTKELDLQQPSSEDPRKFTATLLKELSQEIKDQAVRKSKACHQSESALGITDNEQNQQEHAIDPSPANPERNIGDIGLTKEVHFQQPSNQDSRKPTATLLKELPQEMKEQAGKKGQARHQSESPIGIMDSEQNQHKQVTDPRPAIPERNIGNVGLTKEPGLQQPSREDPRKVTAIPLKEPSQEMKDQAGKKGQARHQSESPIGIMDSEQNQHKQATDPRPANPEKNVGNVGLTEEAGLQQPSREDPRKHTAIPLKEPSQEMKDQAVEKGQAFHQSESPHVITDNDYNQHKQGTEAILGSFEECSDDKGYEYRNADCGTVLKSEGSTSNAPTMLTGTTMSCPNDLALPIPQIEGDLASGKDEDENTCPVEGIGTDGQVTSEQTQTFKEGRIPSLKCLSQHMIESLTRTTEINVNKAWDGASEGQPELPQDERTEKCSLHPSQTTLPHEDNPPSASVVLLSDVRTRTDLPTSSQPGVNNFNDIGETAVRKSDCRGDMKTLAVSEERPLSAEEGRADQQQSAPETLISEGPAAHVAVPTKSATTDTKQDSEQLTDFHSGTWDGGTKSPQGEVQAEGHPCPVDLKITDVIFRHTPVVVLEETACPVEDPFEDAPPLLGFGEEQLQLEEQLQVDGGESQASLEGDAFGFPPMLDCENELADEVDVYGRLPPPYDYAQGTACSSGNTGDCEALTELACSPPSAFKDCGLTNDDSIEVLRVHTNSCSPLPSYSPANTYHSQLYTHYEESETESETESAPAISDTLNCSSFSSDVETDVSRELLTWESEESATLASDSLLGDDDVVQQVEEPVVDIELFKGCLSSHDEGQEKELAEIGVYLNTDIVVLDADICSTDDDSQLDGASPSSSSFSSSPVSVSETVTAESSDCATDDSSHCHAADDDDDDDNEGQDDSDSSQSSGNDTVVLCESLAADRPSVEEAEIPNWESPCPNEGQKAPEKTRVSKKEGCASVPPEGVCTADVSVSPQAAEQTLAHLSEETGSMSRTEAQVLAGLLTTTDHQMLEKVLVTISNASAFTRNQNLLREVGCLKRLIHLLEAHAMALRVGRSVTYPALVTRVAHTVSNLAANEENQKQLQECIPALIDFAKAESAPEAVQVSSLQALTNLSVTSTYHPPYTQLIQRLYECLDDGSQALQLQALRVLVNLSVNPDMVPHLLAAKAPNSLMSAIVPRSDEDLLLRWVSLLANVMWTARERKLTSTSLPTEYKAASPETMWTALYGHNSSVHLRSKVFVLSKHKNQEVRYHSARIYSCLM